jgi:F-type H+-transporting ATPase subunit epsilon
VSTELRLSILSPERRLVEAISVDEITLSGSEGQIQILPGHAPMMGTLQTGVFNYHIPGKTPVYGIISSGFFEVKEDEVYVLAETLELRNEIDIDRAKRAQQLAEQTLQAADLDEHHFKKYQLKLQRSIIRQHLANQG